MIAPRQTLTAAVLAVLAVAAAACSSTGAPAAPSDADLASAAYHEAQQSGPARQRAEIDFVAALSGQVPPADPQLLIGYGDDVCHYLAGGEPIETAETVVPYDSEAQRHALAVAAFNHLCPPPAAVQGLAAVPPDAPSSAAPASAGEPRAAAAVLSGLRVRNADPLGYTRAAFGTPWADVDRNGCDTRNDVLRRDLAQEVTDPNTHGCVVLNGTLHDPYSGTDIAFVRGVGTSTAVQIDHVVSLGDAWRSGANTWTAEQRKAFANNPLNLLAVKGALNESKGDKRADEWLPPNLAERCRYTAIQVTIKANPGPGLPPLTVSEPERKAMADVLGGCGGEPARGAP